MTVMVLCRGMLGVGSVREESSWEAEIRKVKVAVLLVLQTKRNVMGEDCSLVALLPGVDGINEYIYVSLGITSEDDR